MPPKVGWSWASGASPGGGSGQHLNCLRNVKEPKRNEAYRSTGLFLKLWWDKNKQTDWLHNLKWVHTGEVVIFCCIFDQPE